MASSFTTNKSIEKPTYNDYAANPTGWSGAVNADWDIIDKAFGGVLSLNATGSVGTVALTATQAQNLIITITGTMTGNAIYTLPLNTAASAVVGGQWIVYNNTSGSFTVTFSPVSGGGTSVVCAQGKRTIIYSDGTNIAVADDRVSPVTQFPAGTAMLFVQTAAPTGWTKSTTHNNKALRIVSGTASSGGSVDFTTAFSSQGVAGTVGNTTLTIDQIPAHTHTINKYLSSSLRGDGSALNSFSGSLNGNAASNSTGGGLPHTHTFTGTAINLAVAYVDAIICTKD